MYKCSCGREFEKRQSYVSHCSHCIIRLGVDRYNEIHKKRSWDPFHKIPTHECVICHERFYTRAELKSHIKDSHPKNLWRCNFCGEGFKTRKLLHSHKRLTGHFGVNPKNHYSPIHHSGHVMTPDIRKKISDSAKRNGVAGGYRSGSGRGHKGRYKGIPCDSTYELVFLIYCLDHGIEIFKNYTKFPYNWNGKIRYYVPDFKLSDGYVEIKGYWSEQVDAKIKDFPHPIKVLYRKDLNKEFDYVYKTYGTNLLDLYDK